MLRALDEEDQHIPSSLWAIAHCKGRNEGHTGSTLQRIPPHVAC
jgi:hypothetical protein